MWGIILEYMPRPSVTEVKSQIDTHEAVCAERWKEAYENNKAPKIYLRRTNEKSLKIIDLEILKKYAIDLD